MWYRNLIGQTVQLISEDVERGKPIYWSREPAGYKNFIWAHDAEVIESEEAQ